MLSPADADVAQEALLRVITRIGQYEGRSSFRTWAYRIVMNCFLDAKRGRLEGVITSFRGYGEELDKLPLEELEEPPSAERTCNGCARTSPNAHARSTSSTKSARPGSSATTRCSQDRT